MLLELARDAVRRALRGLQRGKAQSPLEIPAILAEEARAQGRLAEAVLLYERALEQDPHNVPVLHNLAVTLLDLNRGIEAVRRFEQAIALDDTFAPAFVNYANLLASNNSSARAEELLRRAQELAPNAPFVDAALGAIKLRRGEIEKGVHLNLSAWLKAFDDDGFASGYLFNCSYSPEWPDETVSAEHIFWGKTLRADPTISDPIYATPELPKEGEKVRIGYLSPDFRNHSVMYFFFPLLLKHDRSRFEIYCYHTVESEDAQTEQTRNGVDVFRKIANFTAADAVALIRQDRLHILVDLAGHTAHNRIELFSARLARLHISALGYPPTSGHTGIDYKVVDSRTTPIGTEHLYSERPLRLAGSFWCFAPFMQYPDPAPPPADKNGYITFGYFGNFSKVSIEILRSWAAILEELPTSKLMLKGLSLADPDIERALRAKLEQAGVPLARVIFSAPDTPEKLFFSYADIDITLDTFPFNGGTTTCFSLWMGVPVITRAGQVLASRMGLSMLRLLGLEECITTSNADYIRAAISLAQDSALLRDLRMSLRSRMRKSALGDPEIFTRDFEKACLEALRNSEVPAEHDAIARTALPAAELVKRASRVMSYGNYDAARRILNYCQEVYPQFGSQKVVESHWLEKVEGLESAIDYIQSQLKFAAAQPDDLDSDDLFALSIGLARCHLLQADYLESKRVLAATSPMQVDALALTHFNLYATCANCWQQDIAPAANLIDPSPFLYIIIPCDDDHRFEEIKNHVSQVLCNGRYAISRTTVESRWSEYQAIQVPEQTDAVVLLRDWARLVSPTFHQDLGVALRHFDVIGSSGATRLTSTRWLDAGFDQLHGAMLFPSPEYSARIELSVFGASRDALKGGMRVLNPSMLIIRPQVFASISADPELEQTDTLVEIDWCIGAADHGFRLGVAPKLAPLYVAPPGQTGTGFCAARLHFNQKHHLHDWPHDQPNLGASIPAPTLDHAIAALQAYYSQ